MTITGEANNCKCLKGTITEGEELFRVGQGDLARTNKLFISF